MKTTVKLISLTSLLWVVFILPLGAQDEGKEIFTKAVELLLTGQMELSMDVQTEDERGRIQEKGYDILMASFEGMDKTRMLMQKPERAKGITIVITSYPEETGVIEIFTPANGKIRKMKATPENMERVGSNFILTEYASLDPSELNIQLLGQEEVDGKNCYKIQIHDAEALESRNTLVYIEAQSNHILRMDFFDAQGNQTHLTTLGDYQPVEGAGAKVQPMTILAEDLVAGTKTQVQITRVLPRPHVKPEEFVLQEAAE